MITDDVEFPYRVEYMTDECKWLANWACSNATRAFADAKSLSEQTKCVTRIIHNYEIRAIYACGIKIA